MLVPILDYAASHVGAGLLRRMTSARTAGHGQVYGGGRTHGGRSDAGEETGNMC